MRTLYLECNMGAAGDMLMAALLELTEDRASFLHTMNHLGLPGVAVSCAPAVSCGITGSHVTVTVHGEEETTEDVHHHHEHHHHHDHDHEQHHHHDHDHDHEHHHDHDHEHDHEHHHHHHHEHQHDHGHHHHHHHTGLAEIRGWVAQMPVSDQVKADVLAVYGEIAAAEGKVHGHPVEEVHFHEVGALDAVADITGVCLLMEQLNVEQVLCSTIHTGFGQVRCAHGILPVPAPATAQLLLGLPCTDGEVEGELCTPTGAALLRHFVTKFAPMPPMTVEKLGCGVGTKQFGTTANLLRARLGTVETAPDGDTVMQLCCNLDDCAGEEIAYATQCLLDAGALDVFSTPIQMKKNRPGILLTCLCRPAEEEQMTRLLLTHTTTLGVRKTLCQRTVLTRREETVETPFGTIRVKVSQGAGITRRKAEFDDLAAAAQAHGVTVDEVRRAVR